MYNFALLLPLSLVLFLFAKQRRRSQSSCISLGKPTCVTRMFVPLFSHYTEHSRTNSLLQKLSINNDVCLNVSIDANLMIGLSKADIF